MRQSSSADSYLDRPRLLDRILGHDDVVFVTASAGAGKSVLAKQLASVEPQRPVFDDVTDNPGEIGGLLEQYENAGPVLMSRRTFDPKLIRQAVDPLVLTDSDLWMTEDEVSALLDQRVEHDGGGKADKGASEAIVSTTRGWPALVSVIVSGLGERPAVRGHFKKFCSRGTHLARIVDPLIAELPEHGMDRLCELAHLGFQIPEFYGWSESTTLDNLRQHGFPFVEEADGSIFVPDAYRLRLASRRPLSTELATSCGGALIDQIGLAGAVRELTDAQAWAALAMVAVEHGDDLWINGHPSILPSLVEASKQTEPNGWLQFVISRLATRLCQFDVFRRSIESAIELATDTDDRYLLLRSTINRHIVYTSAWMQPPPDDVVEQLIERQAEHGDDLSAAELLELRFTISSLKPTSSDKSDGIRLGMQAATAYEMAQRPLVAARVRQLVILGPAFDLGRYQFMAKLLDAVNAKADDDIEPRWSLGLRAVSYACIGDWRRMQQVLDRSEANGRSAYDDVFTGYLWAARMMAAAQTRDVDGTRYAHRRVFESITDLKDGPTGVLWLCQSIEALLLAGDHESARAELEEARARRHFDPAMVGMAELIFEARIGDATIVDQLCRQLIDQDFVSLERRWRLDLERLVADCRQGAAIGNRLDKIISQAAQHGMERAARRLAQGIMQPDDDADPPPSVEICILGSLRVVVGGEPLVMTSGHPTTLLKFLALRGGTAHLDTAIAILWPDVDEDTGRRRIRNVIKRTRELIGAETLRRSGELLILDGSVVIDLEELHGAIATATSAAAGSDEFRTAAVKALELARPGLLADEPYADWASDDRWHIESVSRRLLGELGADREGDVPTEWLIDVAIDLDVMDESVFFDLARRALAAQSTQVARQAIEGAERVANRLNVPLDPPADLAGLLADH